MLLLEGGYLWDLSTEYKVGVPHLGGTEPDIKRAPFLEGL